MNRLLSAIIITALFLSSCGSAVAKPPDVTADTTAEITEIAENTINFDTVEVTGYKVLCQGETVKLSQFDGSAETAVSSHPSTAKIQGDKLYALTPGVALLYICETDTAYAVCVTTEEKKGAMGSSAPILLQVGETSFVQGFGSSQNFYSDAPEIASLSGTQVTALSPGLAMIDVSNISMPKYFYYIVYDRTVE